MATGSCMKFLASRVANIAIRNIPVETEMITARSFKTCCYPHHFQMTPVVCGEPLKKKKRIDPAVIKKREDRKRRKLEKGIRKLERSAQKLKPIEEVEVSKKLMKELNLRRRKVEQLSFEEAENHARLQKEWSQYKLQQHAAEMNMMNRITVSQEHALSELRNESEELYQAAIQIDSSFIPFKTTGPVAMLPIKDYEPPNGIYVDTTKKWDQKIDLPPPKPSWKK